ncbi:DUF4260 domain-containing protein [Ktedonospora formicarum]|uniref:DUF4260 domain-containing protein n=1 Tax=Ktedonospora formicarum TaxID=2778364 RepID=A0A8J3IDS1_9CHLR|nr:DUF4260 domain-containing protein [Ktedonospora formicarum]GHO49464.1 hypothetical protein KSX_76270 [Ktedonospora formicarum]
MKSRSLFDPKILLHIEGAAVLLVALILYFWQGGYWWLLLLLILAPDVSMLGYLAGNRVGAICYNIVHAYVLPLALALYGAIAGVPLILWLALIWFAHIGGDRALGYGLKYPTEFKDTHLQRV